MSRSFDPKFPKQPHGAPRAWQGWQSVFGKAKKSWDGYGRGEKRSNLPCRRAGEKPFWPDGKKHWNAPKNGRETQLINTTIRLMRTKLGHIVSFLGVILAGFSAPAAPVGLNLFAEGFTSPIVLVPLPDGSGRLLVADQIGTI